MQNALLYNRNLTIKKRIDNTNRTKKKKYYSVITFFGTEKPRKLSEWDTPEEAFAEYKRMKQADILRVAAGYKEKIPEHIYKKFLEVEVKPY